MAKQLKLPHVKFVRKKGVTYAYFNTGEKVNGKPVRVPMPKPTDTGFYDSYAALKAGRTKRKASGYTIDHFIDDYLESRAYTERAVATQKLYRVQLNKLSAVFGKLPISGVEARHIRQIVEKEPWGAATKNAFLSAVGALYAWGRKDEKTALRPVDDIEKFTMGQHDPWPEDILDEALAANSDRVRLAVHILYFTGLRISDACALRWGDISDGIVTVTPTKTRRFEKTLYITLASELRAELERTSKRGITILADTDGKPLRAERLRRELQAFTLALGVETVPHGLRKNAVNALLEAGCTIAEVASITGQSMQVIEHYARKVNNRKLGQAAMLKFEAKRKNEA